MKGAIKQGKSYATTGAYNSALLYLFVLFTNARHALSELFICEFVLSERRVISGGRESNSRHSHPRSTAGLDAFGVYVRIFLSPSAGPVVFFRGVIWLCTG